MGKIQNMLPSLIIEAMKEKNQIRKNAYTNLKTAFMQYTTSKEGAKECAVDENGNRIITDAKELTIVKKMHDELIVNGTQYNLPDYITEASYFEPFIPAAASKEDIENVLNKLVDSDTGISQKEMGKYIKAVKEQLPNADGKMVSEIVRGYIVK